MTKEQVYDEQINPLMAKIIDIAKEHKIAMVASFSLVNNGDGEYDLCTTALTTEPYDPPSDYRKIVNILFPPKPSFAAFMITKGGN